MAPPQAKRTPFVVLLLALVVGAMSLLLVLNTASAANEVDRHNAAVADSALAARLVDLRNQINASAAPANIARVARSLGMVPADAPAFLRIDADGKVKLLGRPAAATAPAAPASTKAKSTAKSTATSATKATSTTGATGTVTPGGKTAPAQGATSKSTGTKTSPANSAPADAPSPTPTPPSTFSLGGGAR